MAVFWGKVYDASTGWTIEGADVQFKCNCGAGWNDTTDENGNYDISPPYIADHGGHKLNYNCYKLGYLATGALLTLGTGSR